MRLFRSARWFMLALLLSIVPASSYAGVFISVNFGPPVLPVYEQPPCPDEGLMWMPGYWAYGPDGYFWVPGAWVEAPYEGALWTPGYWGWQDGYYIWHEGYWGAHVGYYGGVNYGYGYMGIGFVGGMWREHHFIYNTAVIRVDERRIHNTYIDRQVVQRNTIINDRRVAFSGGPGGIRHDALPEERLAARDQHINRTAIQSQHESSFQNDRSSYYKNNNGRPSNPALTRPLGVGSGGNSTGTRQGQQNSIGNRPGSSNTPGNQSQPMRQSIQTPQSRQMQPQNQTQQQDRQIQQQNRQVQQQNQMQQNRSVQQPNQMQQNRVTPQSQSSPRTNQAQPSRQAEQSHPASESRPSSAPQNQHQSKTSAEPKHAEEHDKK